MADTVSIHPLADAWADVNKQMEYRKMLLDQSVAFHSSAIQVRPLRNFPCFRRSLYATILAMPPSDPSPFQLLDLPVRSDD